MHISGCFDNENGAPVRGSFAAGDVVSNRCRQSAIHRHPQVPTKETQNPHIGYIRTARISHPTSLKEPSQNISLHPRLTKYRFERQKHLFDELSQMTLESMYLMPRGKNDAMLHISGNTMGFIPIRRATKPDINSVARRR